MQALSVVRAAAAVGLLRGKCTSPTRWEQMEGAQAYLVVEDGRLQQVGKRYLQDGHHTRLGCLLALVAERLQGEPQEACERGPEQQRPASKREAVGGRRCELCYRLERLVYGGVVQCEPDDESSWGEYDGGER